MNKFTSIILSAAIILCICSPSFAINDSAKDAAESLNSLGLFNGVGTNADGTPNFDLDRTPSRNEAVTMLVRLLGKENEAKSQEWETPFQDLDVWVKPYVGYAYNNKLTNGISATEFGGAYTVTTSQYLTFVLRALGYDSSQDFQYDKAWELSDKIGLTCGDYGLDTDFKRGDVAIISKSAMPISYKSGESTLIEALVSSGSVSAYAAQEEGYDVDLPRDGEIVTLILDSKRGISKREILGKFSDAQYIIKLPSSTESASARGVTEEEYFIEYALWNAHFTPAVNLLKDTVTFTPQIRNHLENGNIVSETLATYFMILDSNYNVLAISKGYREGSIAFERKYIDTSDIWNEIMSKVNSAYDIALKDNVDVDFEDLLYERNGYNHYPIYLDGVDISKSGTYYLYSYYSPAWTKVTETAEESEADLKSLIFRLYYSPSVYSDDGGVTWKLVRNSVEDYAIKPDDTNWNDVFLLDGNMDIVGYFVANLGD